MVGTDSKGLRAGSKRSPEAGAIGAVGHSRGATGRGWDGAARVRTIDGAEPAHAGGTARVASVTKVMVSTLAMQEVDRRRWMLGTTVGDVLPGLLPRHDDVTLEQLLSQPWPFEPGTDFSYSNTNYVVVGLMLERATKRSMRSLLEQRVFSPARMTSARFPASGPTFAGRRHITDYANFERPYNLDRHSSTIFSSAGAVVASARDIASFYRALFSGHLVSKGSLDQMLEPPRTPEVGCGQGIYRAGDPRPGPDGEPQLLFGHDGAAFGTR